MSKFPIALALVSLLAACSQSGDGDNKRKDRSERRAERGERDNGERGNRGDRKGRIAAQDQNGDGVITRAEFSGKDRRFKRMDTNGDGNLTAGEF